MSLSIPTELVAKFAVGFCGAAFTLYSNIGGDLPGMGQSNELKNLAEDIGELEDRISVKEAKLKDEEDKLSKGEISIAQFAVMERSITNQRNAWNEQILELRTTRSDLRKSTYFRAALIFVILGGFFATFLTGGALIEGGKLNAQTILSAVAIGAGWTGIISKYLQTGEIEKANREIDKKLLDIRADVENNIDAIIKEKAKVYKEKIAFVNDEKEELVALYEKIVDGLQKKVKDGEKVVEDFNKIKESIKGTQIAEELAKLGFPI